MCSSTTLDVEILTRSTKLPQPSNCGATLTEIRLRDQSERGPVR